MINLAIDFWVTRVNFINVAVFAHSIKTIDTIEIDRLRRNEKKRKKLCVYYHLEGLNATLLVKHNFIQTFKIVTIELSRNRFAWSSIYPLKRNCIDCQQRVQIPCRWPFLAVDLILMLPSVCSHSINSLMMSIDSAANELTLNHMF